MRPMIQKFDIKEHKGCQNWCPSCLSPFFMKNKNLFSYDLSQLGDKLKKNNLRRLDYENQNNRACSCRVFDS